jgi:hypothetical protein
MSEKNWREIYRDEDDGGDKVIDVWVKGGKPLAYEYHRVGQSFNLVTTRVEMLVLLPPPRRYTFLEAVEMMERGKKMRLVGWPGAEFTLWGETMMLPGGENALCTTHMVKGQWEEVPNEQGR